MNIPHLNLTRLPNEASNPSGGHRGRSIPSADPPFLRQRPVSGGSGGTPRPPPSSGETPMTSPRQAAVYSSPAAFTAMGTASPTPSSTSLARRAADLAGVLDFDVTHCTDVATLQRKVIETAERLVRAERWYEEQLTNRSSYYHHRLAHLSRYISEVEMASAPRNINFPSSGNRSSSLHNRSSSESLQNSVIRGPGNGFTTIPSRQLPQPTNATLAGEGGSGAAVGSAWSSSLERQPAAVTAVPINSGARSGRHDSGNGAGSARAVNTPDSKAFTDMVRNILNRDRNDAQGDRRRRVASTTGSGSGTPLKGADSTGGDDGGATTGRQKQRRTASKPRLQGRPSRGGSGNRSGRAEDATSSSSTPTRKHQVYGGGAPHQYVTSGRLAHQRRSSVGSASSAFSNNSRKSRSRSSSLRRKRSMPVKGVSTSGQGGGTGRRASATKRNKSSPVSLSINVGAKPTGLGRDEAGRSAANTASNSENGVSLSSSAPGGGPGGSSGFAPSTGATHDLYFTSKPHAVGGGGADPEEGARHLSDSVGRNMREVKRGSDSRPQPPSHTK